MKLICEKMYIYFFHSAMFLSKPRIGWLEKQVTKERLQILSQLCSIKTIECLYVSQRVFIQFKLQYF